MSATPPDNHPLLGEGSSGTCPVSGASYEFRPPQEGDSRSPCPALNTMANHGYISRSGKSVSASEISRGLQACYGLSAAFSNFLSYTTFVVLGQFSFKINLYDIGKHNVIEHNASLVHHDTPEGEKYAPIAIDQKLVDALVNDATAEAEIDVVGADGVKSTERHKLLTIEDVARARIRREAECNPVSALNAQVARGEMAIIMAVWAKQAKDNASVNGLRVDWLKRWIGEERLPDDFVPVPNSVGFGATRTNNKAIAAAMVELKKKAEEAAKKD